VPDEGTRSVHPVLPGTDLPARDALLAVDLFILVVGLMVLARLTPRVFDGLRIPSAKTGWMYGAAAGVGLIFVLLDAAPEPFIYFRF